jgi:hypothetical protein
MQSLRRYDRNVIVSMRLSLPEWLDLRERSELSPVDLTTVADRIPNSSPRDVLGRQIGQQADCAVGIEARAVNKRLPVVGGTLFLRLLFPIWHLFCNTI